MEENTEWMEGLTTRLARVEAALAELTKEVRTRRLVVVDDDGQERITGEIVRGTAELSVDLPGQPPGRRSSVLAFANPGDEELGLPPGLGVQLWLEGDAVDEFGAWLGMD